MKTISNDTELKVDDSIHELDFKDYYTDYFLSSLNKAQSYKKACEVTGYTYNSKYLTQYAYAYHKRIDSTGELKRALDERLFNQAIKAHNKLGVMLDSSDSEQIQYQVAKLQVGNMYNKDTEASGITVNVNRDNVTISHKNQSLTITPDKDTECYQ